MQILKYGAIILLSVSAFFILIFACISGKPFKTLLLNSIIGFGVLGIIDLTSSFTGAYIPINEFTGIGSAVFGLPAVCSFLLLKIIFI